MWCACSCLARAARVSCSRSRRPKARRCGISARACRRSRTCSRTRWAKTDANPRPGVQEIRRHACARTRVARDAAERRHRNDGQSAVDCPDDRVLDSVRRSCHPVLHRGQLLAGGHCRAVRGDVPRLLRPPGSLRVSRDDYARRGGDCRGSAHERPADLPVETADTPRVPGGQAVGADGVSAVHHVGAGDSPAHRPGALRGQLHLPEGQFLSVPGHHALLADRSRDGVDVHAGVVVAVDERPIRRDPLHRVDLLQRCALRRAARGHRQHESVVGGVRQQPRASRRRHLPSAVALRNAVDSVAGDCVRSDWHRSVDSRAAGASRGDRRVSGSDAGTVVAAEHLSKWYGQVIGLNDVSVSVPRGITGLLGPNGAGKSTFMKLITGQLKPSKGSITVLGEPIWQNPSAYFRLGFCPEQDKFYERMTGLEWVTALVRLNGVSDSDAASMASRAIEMVELTDASNKKIGAYSKGMRQRIKMAQALAHDPELLILDEPLSGMDPIARRKTIRLIKDWGRAGKGVIVSSHILHEIESMTA